MMRCKRHPSDLSSSVGVCATCLRESLFSLIAAQARQQAVATAAQAEEDRRKSDAHHHHHPHPHPLIFPRSVSPYICRRSDDSSWSHNQYKDRRFYSTPQVGPTFSSTTTTTTTAVHSCSTTKKKKHTSKYSLFSSLFKSTRSVEAETDPRVSKGSPFSSPISSAASSSSSWFSSLLSSRRKKQSRFCSQDETIIPPHPAANLHRTRRRRDRGMSPSDREEYMEEEAEGSPSASGYSSESSQGWRKSGSMRTPARRKGGGTHNRNVSGMAFCLSPLVRASPNRHRNQKDGGLPASMVFSGEIGRGGSKCHLSTAASLCANRSRKLADFGRYNYNP